MRWLTGRYRLDTPVGRGGMAVVWRGYDAVLRRVVAIKMLPDRGTDARSRKRLRDEAHTAARLSHPAIASVYDYGEAPVGLRRRAPFLVMEYVEGPTLSARLSAGALPWANAVRICAEVAAALAFAHANKLRPPRHQTRQRDAVGMRGEGGGLRHCRQLGAAPGRR
jgi:serine/threonine-protein kinase